MADLRAICPFWHICKETCLPGSIYSVTKLEAPDFPKITPMQIVSIPAAVPFVAKLIHHLPKRKGQPRSGNGRLSMAPIPVVVRLLAFLGAVLLSCAAADADTIKLFNGRDLDGWYVFTTSTNYENPGAFTVQGGAIRVAGGRDETAWFGGLITRQEYANYKLTFDYKWGGPTYGTRLNKARDAGVLLHCIGPNEPGPCAADLANPLSSFAFGWLGLFHRLPCGRSRRADQNQGERHIICEFRGNRMVGGMLDEDDQVPKCQNVSVRQSMRASRASRL
jgi:hypothetical protein